MFVGNEDYCPVCKQMSTLAEWWASVIPSSILEPGRMRAYCPKCGVLIDRGWAIGFCWHIGHAVEVEGAPPRKTAEALKAVADLIEDRWRSPVVCLFCGSPIADGRNALCPAWPVRASKTVRRTRNDRMGGKTSYP